MQSKKLFIVVLLQNLKRVGEGALRWSFFSLNLFMLALYICQNWGFIHTLNLPTQLQVSSIKAFIASAKISISKKFESTIKASTITF